MTDAAQLQLLTLLSVIVGLIYQEIRASRQRRWDVEDRAVREVKVDAQALHAAQARTDMAVKLEENTGLTKAAIVSADAAFHEANTVNVKIEQLATSANAAIAAEARGERRHSDAVRADLATAKALGLVTPPPEPER